MHLWERSRMRRDSNTGGLGAKRACTRFKKRFARVSVAHMFVTRASPVKCDLVAHIQRLHVCHRLSSP